jgi:CBS domain-containing protein
MTAAEFAALCVPASLTLREALAALDQTARGILMVLDEDGRLRRTLTDGDLRRAGTPA